MFRHSDFLFNEEQWEALAERLALPLRQRQVIRQLFACRSDKQIAEDLGIALPTVRSHLRRIYLKFNVQDRTELVLHIMCEFNRMYDVSKHVSKDDISPDDNTQDGVTPNVTLKDGV